MAAHLYAFDRMAHDRFGDPFNAAPALKVTLASPTQWVPDNWNRLAVSRWDAQHYIDIFLRGYSQCPKKGPIDVTALYTCQLNFYPGYSFLGWLVSFGGRLPADYALFGVSLVAGFIVLYTWTGPTLVRYLGVGGAYASLAGFSVFASGYAIVAILTEPCLIACSILALRSLDRKQYLRGALLAGAAGGFRITGAAVGPAYALALVVLTVRDPPPRAAAWWRRALEIVLSGWGLLALLAYLYVRVGDPLAYVHAHSISYNHKPEFWSIFFPNAEWIKRSLYDPLHAGIWVFSIVMWFALGHRAALRRFPVEMQVYCYALFALTVFISVSGSITNGLMGNSRYMLAVLPSFFAMGAVLKRRPVALVMWLCVSLWLYWEADLCHYVGGNRDRFGKCHDELVAGAGY